ncbi:MAG TPA: DUF357 domain-containing protein [Candidatus Nanoarchaeia archaeon]|nr:DUF357 domain-containing protein [Candidatus Nanoarchaeia archaeon]
MDKITDQKLDRYFDLTERALEKAKKSGNKLGDKKIRDDFIDMIERYVSDAKHFRKNKDYVNSFAAISYAHGWLDAGARIGLFDVHDSELFTID